jgi:hypothetical protein
VNRPPSPGGPLRIFVRAVRRMMEPGRGTTSGALSSSPGGSESSSSAETRSAPLAGTLELWATHDLQTRSYSVCGAEARPFARGHRQCRNPRRAPRAFGGLEVWVLARRCAFRRRLSLVARGRGASRSLPGRQPAGCTGATAWTFSVPAHPRANCYVPAMMDYDQARPRRSRWDPQRLGHPKCAA